MRWITLLGRTGTVLIMIGLALVVVSLIPPATGSYSTHGGIIEPEKYRLAHSGDHTPQTGFQISVESTDDVDVYILGVSLDEVDNWQTQVTEAYPDLPFVVPEGDSHRMDNPFIIPLVFLMEAYPDLEDPQFEDIMDIMWDIAVLDTGLQTYPEIIQWQSSPGTTLSHEFFPTDVLYISVMVANRSPDTVEVETEIRDLTALAAKERVVMAAKLLVSTGIALVILWLFLRQYRKSVFS